MGGLILFGSRKTKLKTNPFTGRRTLVKIKTTDMNYDVQHFINKFEAIPEDKWTTGSRGTRENELGEYCAYGHCGIRHGVYLDSTQEAIALAKLFYHIDRTPFFCDLSFGVCWINDGKYGDYQQDTPKQRILAALYDIKKLQQPAYVDLTKSLAVLPEDKIEVDVNVKELV
jgi:hypothetical protein